MKQNSLRKAVLSRNPHKITYAILDGEDNIDDIKIDIFSLLEWAEANHYYDLMCAFIARQVERNFVHNELATGYQNILEHTKYAKNTEAFRTFVSDRCDRDKGQSLAIEDATADFPEWVDIKKLRSGMNLDRYYIFAILKGIYNTPQVNPIKALRYCYEYSFAQESQYRFATDQDKEAISKFVVERSSACLISARSIFDEIIDIESLSNNPSVVLFAAALAGDYNATKIMSKAGAILEDFQDLQLIELYKNSYDDDALASLIIACVDFKDTNNNSLTEKILNFMLHKALEAYIEKGGDLNFRMEDDKTILEKLYYSSCDQPRLMAMLIRAGAKLGKLANLSETSLLHYAAKQGSAELASALIEREGFDMELQPYEVTGNTPLHLAVYHGHQEVAEILISNGANVNAMNQYQYAPLHFIFICGKKDCLQLLLSSDEIDVNLQDSDGNTPLHTILYQKYVNLKDVLYWMGFLLSTPQINVNTQNKSGETPLILAVGNWGEEAARLLIKHGANVNIRNKSGETALFCALQRNDVNLIRLIREVSMGTMASRDADVLATTANIPQTLQGVGMNQGPIPGIVQGSTRHRIQELGHQI